MLWDSIGWNGMVWDRIVGITWIRCVCTLNSLYQDEEDFSERMGGLNCNHPICSTSQKEMSFGHTIPNTSSSFASLSTYLPFPLLLLLSSALRIHLRTHCPKTEGFYYCDHGNWIRDESGQGRFVFLLRILCSVFIVFKVPR